MIFDRDLIRRSVATSSAYTLSRLKVLEAIPGNPIGIAYRRVGAHGWALLARHLPAPGFNAIAGIEAGDEGEIAALLAWYGEHGVTPEIPVTPGFESDALLNALSRAGYAQSGFRAAMIADPHAVPPPDPAVAVERVADRATLEEFLDAYAAGRAVPDREGFKRNVRRWAEQPGWSLFLGRADGKPAAAAILYVLDGFGYCADAATDPAFRGRGLQTALIAHRLRAAAEAGASYVSANASFLSGSHRNMARAGMALHFVSAVWTVK